MDIEFGKLQQAMPQFGLRPDQDGQLIVASIGDPQPDQLRVYVDLDVMREMEAHAISNTRVELGGVMLGYQRLDGEGKPFVVVSDCLRAEHYEATKGSFKFTHETWSQITRDRAKFRPDLEMVGWYHTHPGWSVFLSGMDLFICDNFFNRPLDVALVIDPCAGDRGFFYWSNQARSARSTVQEVSELEGEDDLPMASVPRRTDGFFLSTGRFRELELTYFANLYSRDPKMNHDPRYVGQSNTILPMGTGQTMVQLMDQRKPIFEIALASMMLMQFLLIALIGWRISASGLKSDNSVEVRTYQSRLMDLENGERSRIAQQAQNEILQMVVNAQAGSPDFVEKYTETKTALDQMSSNLTAQIAMTEKLKADLATSTKELEQKNFRNERLSNQLEVALRELDEAKSQVTTLVKANKKAENGAPQSQFEAIRSKLELPWWAALISSLGILGIGGGAGFLVARSAFVRTKLDDEFLGAAEEN